MPMLEAVLFDMDGLLFDTERLYLKSWKKASEEAGIDFSEDLFFRCVGTNTRDTKKIIFDALGEDFPFDQFEQITSQAVIDEIKANGPPLKKGVHSILAFLKERNIKMALATSTGKEMAKWMVEKAGLELYFDAYAFGSEVKQGKPHPDIFLLAAKNLGVDAENCLVLEDSNFGLQAGQSAGMKTLFIKDLVDPPMEVLAKVWNSASDLLEARDLIKELL
ncbi:MAG TPA: HAD family phosphatase [Treponemataceae bacterium]|nr:HAD family phosphatase [Treponemataceae bacterium]